MTLPASGALSISAINTEFGRGNNLNAYRGTTWYTDAGSSGTFSAGAISMNEFYGKRLTSPTFSFTISSNQTNANLRSLAVAAGWNQSSAVIATVASGVWVYSTSTGTPGLTINGSFPGGVTLINNGNIIGMGGAGAENWGTAGQAGGDAISLGVSCTITNNSYIAGGGGGGGCGFWGASGGGAGGGQGGGVVGSIAATPGGGIGASGSNGATRNTQIGKYESAILGAGGGGGRVLPGAGGAGGTWNGGPYGRGGGAGGGGGTGANAAGSPGGGAGGGANSAGTSRTNAYVSPGGGGWGAAGGNYVYGSANNAGGAGGRAVALNGYSITWNATGTRYGAIS